MSATLPARLGEPSRALIVARRIGRARESLPTVLGTLVSQTLLNIFALVILGACMFATVGLFHGRERALVLYGAAPIALLALVAIAPVLLRAGDPATAPAAVCTRGRRAPARPPRGCATACACSASRGSARRPPRAARGVGPAVALVLPAARGARSRPPRWSRRGCGRPVRGKRHRGAPGDPLERRRVPGRVRRRAQRRLRRLVRRRARLRDHPAGGRGGDGGDDGHARPGQGGAVLARRPDARAAGHAGGAAGPTAQPPRRGPRARGVSRRA